MYEQWSVGDKLLTVSHHSVEIFHVIQYKCCVESKLYTLYSVSCSIIKIPLVYSYPWCFCHMHSGEKMVYRLSYQVATSLAKVLIVIPVLLFSFWSSGKPQLIVCTVFHSSCYSHCKLNLRACIIIVCK